MAGNITGDDFDSTGGTGGNPTTGTAVLRLPVTVDNTFTDGGTLGITFNGGLDSQTIYPNQSRVEQLLYDDDIIVRSISTQQGKWFYGFEITTGTPITELEQWGIIKTSTALNDINAACTWAKDNAILFNAYYIYKDGSQLFKDNLGNEELETGYHVDENNKIFFYDGNSLPTSFLDPNDQSICPTIVTQTNYPAWTYSIMNATNLAGDILTTVSETCNYIEQVGYEVISQNNGITLYFNDNKLYTTPTGVNPQGGSSELVSGRYYAVTDYPRYFQYLGTIPTEIKECVVQQTLTAVCCDPNANNYKAVLGLNEICSNAAPPCTYNSTGGGGGNDNNTAA